MDLFSYCLNISLKAHRMHCFVCITVINSIRSLLNVEDDGLFLGYNFKIFLFCIVLPDKSSFDHCDSGYCKTFLHRLIIHR